MDGLVEVFEGLAQMFAGVSEQLDMLAANAKTEDELELPVAEQPVLPVTEKKGPAVSHPRKKPVKKTKKVEEAATSAIEETAEMPVVEDSGEAEEARTPRVQKPQRASIRWMMRMRCRGQKIPVRKRHRPIKPLARTHLLPRGNAACSDDHQGRDHGGHCGEDQEEA